jgi:hypothetical protein
VKVETLGYINLVGLIKKNGNKVTTRSFIAKYLHAALKGAFDDTPFKYAVDYLIYQSFVKDAVFRVIEEYAPANNEAVFDFVVIPITRDDFLNLSSPIMHEVKLHAEKNNVKLFFLLTEQITNDFIHEDIVLEKAAAYDNLFSLKY